MPVFERFSPEVMRALLLGMESRVYSKKSLILDMHTNTDLTGVDNGNEDSLIRGSAPAEGMYIIKSGVVNTIEPVTTNVRKHSVRGPGSIKGNTNAWTDNANGTSGSSFSSTSTADGRQTQAKVVQRYPGDTFAGATLVEEWTANPYQARAVTDTEVLYLSRSHFQLVMRRYPAARAHIEYVNMGYV